VLGQQELKVAKQQLVKAARSVRSDFIRRTFVVTLLACVVGFGGHIVLSIYESTMQKLMKPEQFLLLRSVLVSLPRIGIANLFYAVVRNQNISYENLRLMDKYCFHPLERFGYIFIVTMVMGILLYFNVVTLGLAGIILNEFKTNPEYALITALVCGLSEPIVINIVRDVSRPKAQPDTPAKPVAST
jgi:hypothetical protein